jgi:hypothetical protein
MRRLCFLLLLAIASPAAAQAPDEPIRLTIHPASLPSPALKYQLLPRAEDWVPGNAVLHYYRAFAPDWNGWQRQPGIFERIDRALSSSLQELPRKEFAWLLSSHQLSEVDLAARCTYVDWDFTERMKKEGYNLLLPDVQGFRQFANLLALRGRLELADRQYHRVAYSLQSGFALSRHVAEAPLLISALVGVATANVQAAQVEQWLQISGSPNLYWALTNLPRPFIDLRKPLQGEQLILQAALPAGLQEIDRAAMSGQQQQALVDALVRLMHLGQPREQPGDRAGLLVLVLKGYPEAKQALLAQGRKPAELEAMPMVQVYTIHALQQFRQLRDDALKWFSLPYPEGQAGLDRIDKQLREAHRRLQGGPFLELIPGYQRLYVAPAQPDRKIAALRCIEAIRLYAAGHDGELPAQLSDIREVPIPPDPLTGRPFVYHQAGNKATLAGGQRAPGAPPAGTLIYELTLEP